MDAIDLQPVGMVDEDNALQQRFSVECARRGFCHEAGLTWPAAPGQKAADVAGRLLASATRSEFSQAIWDSGHALALVRIQDGEAGVTAKAASPSEAQECLEMIRELLPPYVSADPGLIPVTFWTASPHGGSSMMRDVDAPDWEAIAVNYPAADGLANLMSADYRPGAGGQLILWHGDPGTGKTTALRALAREWRDWCSLHYIVDPDAFFGTRADYMMQVMTSHDLEPLSLKTDASHRSEPRWRLLVLEDCGEMLQPDAKREVGQALARLLNACDGLIGRGLRILVLLTTNEPAEKLHDAVARPGRCAARIEFKPFTRRQAQFWLASHGQPDDVSEGCTLADLYGRLGDFSVRRERRPVGFAV